MPARGLEREQGTMWDRGDAPLSDRSQGQGEVPYPKGKQEKEERNHKLLAPPLLSKTPVLSPSFPKPSLFSPSLRHPYICFTYSELSKVAIFPLSFSLLITHLEPSLQILSFPHRAECLYPALAVTTTWMRAVQSLCHFPVVWWRAPLANGGFGASLCSHFTPPWTFG